jgi:hypothetical protein
MRMGKNNRRVAKGGLSAIIAPPEAMSKAEGREGEKPLWQPFPGFQTECLSTTAFEILLSGAKGTGKSAVARAFIIKGNQHRPLYDARGKLIEINASYINHSKYTSLILRKNQQDLRDFIEHSKELYEPLGAQYYTNPITIKWPKGGITYTGHLSDESSWGKYLGVEIHRLVIEELVLIEHPEIYEKLRTCVRSSRPGIIPQIMCTTNPFGPGVGWIREWWTQAPDGKEIPPGELYEVVTKEKGTGKEFKTSRIWYFGKWGDNPVQHTDEYKAQMLAGNAEHLIKAYVYGEWDAASGSYLPHFRRHGPLPGEPPEANHMIAPREVYPYERVVIGADWGSTHKAAGVRLRGELDGRVVVEDSFAESGMTTMSFGELLAEMVRGDLKNLDSPVDVYLSPDCWARESEVDSEFKRIVRGIARVVGPERVVGEDEDPIDKTMLDEPGRILVRRANNARIAGWTLLSELMMWKQEVRERGVRQFSHEEADRVWREQGEEAWRRYRKAWMAATPRPRPGFMIADTPRNEALCTALGKMQHGKKGDGDITKAHWEGADIVDALRYGLLSMSTAPRELDARMLMRLRLQEMEKVKPETEQDFRANWFFSLNAAAMEKRGLLGGGMVDRLVNTGRRRLR